MNTLIIGASRGIGLELCRQAVARGDRVYATCRSPGDALRDSGATLIDNVDVSGPEGADRLRRELGDIPLDLLIHNAGILGRESLDAPDFENIEEQFRVNTLGPLRSVHALLGNLSEGARIGLMSSRMGSIEDNGSGGMYGYRISKAGLNAAGMSLARDLHPRGIAVALLHPGLVATDMTGNQGVSPEDSARGIMQVMQRLTLEESGKFWHAEGYLLPW